jgi:hypothetical protein
MYQLASEFYEIQCCLRFTHSCLSTSIFPMPELLFHKQVQYSGKLGDNQNAGPKFRIRLLLKLRRKTGYLEILEL